MTQAEFEEHLAFLETIAERYRTNIRNLTEPRAWLALDYELRGLEGALLAKDEFARTAPERMQVPVTGPSNDV